MHLRQHLLHPVGLATEPGKGAVPLGGGVEAGQNQGQSGQGHGRAAPARGRLQQQSGRALTGLEGVPVGIGVVADQNIR